MTLVVTCTVVIGDPDTGETNVSATFSKAVLPIFDDASQNAARIGKAMQQSIDIARDDSLDQLGEWIESLNLDEGEKT